MFFLLLGTRASEAMLLTVRFICHYCGVDAPQQVFRRSTKFTLFFVPLFTLRSTNYNRCTNCGGTTALTREQTEHALTTAPRA